MEITSKLFDENQEENRENLNMNIAFDDYDYCKSAQRLFSCYLINSYSKGIRAGETDTKFIKFATIAKNHQDLTFKDYCDSIVQGKDVVGVRPFETENTAILISQSLLSDNYDKSYMDFYCGVISRVYESILATEIAHQTSMAAKGYPTDHYEATSQQLDTYRDLLKIRIENVEDYTENLNIFTRQGFERTGKTTTENARQDMIDLESEHPYMLEWGLTTVAAATNDAEKIVAKHNRDFHSYSPEENFDLQKDFNVEALSESEEMTQ